MSKSSAWTCIFLIVLGVTLGLTIAEGLIRVWIWYVANEETLLRYARYDMVPDRLRQFSPHPFLNYYPTPNYKSVDGLNTHNSLGFRGAEIARPKPSGHQRIVVMGGSTIYTSHVQNWRLSFPVQLEYVLRSSGYPNVEVINAGVPGWDSWQHFILDFARVLWIE